MKYYQGKKSFFNLSQFDDGFPKSVLSFYKEITKTEYDARMVYTNNFKNEVIEESKKSTNGPEKFVDYSDIGYIGAMPKLQLLTGTLVSNKVVIDKEINIWKRHAFSNWNKQYMKDVVIGGGVIIRAGEYNNPYNEDIESTYLKALTNFILTDDKFVNNMFNQYSGYGSAKNWIELNSKFDIANNQKIELSQQTFIRLAHKKFSNLLGEIKHNDKTGIWYENIPCNDIVVRGIKTEFSANGKIFVYNEGTNVWSYTNTGSTKVILNNKVIRFWYNVPSIKVIKTKIVQDNKTITEQIIASMVWLNTHYTPIGHILDKIVDIIFECKDTSALPAPEFDGIYRIKNYESAKSQLTLYSGTKTIYVYRINNVWRYSAISMNDSNGGFFEHMFKSAYKCESNKL